MTNFLVALFLIDTRSNESAAICRRFKLAEMSTDSVLIPCKDALCVPTAS